MKLFIEIFFRFLWLGLTAFGGPVAHLAYFRYTFVEKLRWLREEELSSFISLSQILPGPGSSQTGFAIGLHRGGFIGGLLAFLGFTLPGFLMMTSIALISEELLTQSQFKGIIHGLKIMAVAVVVDAVSKMSAKFCTNKKSWFISIITVCVALIWANTWGQITMLIIAILLGIFWFKPEKEISGNSSLKISSLIYIFLFFTFLIGLPFFSSQSKILDLSNGFYQAGSLVFGGGHVVLPLLQNGVAQSIPKESFLLGYATVQGAPGPMFNLSAFLGAEIHDNYKWFHAILATFSIFLPGFLLILGFKNNWQSILRKKRFHGASRGINASVVGLLLAALYNPVFTSSVKNSLDMAAVFMALFLIRSLKWHICFLIPLFAVYGYVINLN